MPVCLGAIAEDFTGATDLANTWVKAGVRVAQIIGVPDGSSAHPMREARLMTLMAAQSIQAAGRVTHQAVRQGAAAIRAAIAAFAEPGCPYPVIDALSDDDLRAIGRGAGHAAGHRRLGPWYGLARGPAGGRPAGRSRRGQPARHRGKRAGDCEQLLCRDADADRRGVGQMAAAQPVAGAACRRRCR